MKCIGITGGIGSGKSTVSAILRIMGYPVYDSDMEARNLMNNDPKLMHSIKAVFGPDSYDNEGLNRQHLAQIVFSERGKLKELESLVHPAVEKHFIEWCSSQNKPLIFKEAAIMFESGANKKLDAVICITAPQDTRIKRVIKRDGISKQEVLNRIASQWPEEKKIELSDFVIYADDQHSIILQLREIIKQLYSNSR